MCGLIICTMSTDEPQPFTRSQSAEDTYTETSAQNGLSALGQVESNQEERITVGSCPGTLTTVPQREQQQHQSREAFVSGASVINAVVPIAGSLSESEVRRKPPTCRVYHPASEESSSGEETDIPRSSSPSSSSTCSSDNATTPDSESEHRLLRPLPDMNGVGPIFEEKGTVEFDRQDICAEICGFRCRNPLKRRCKNMTLGGLEPKLEIELIPQRNQKKKEHVNVDVYVKFSDGRKAKKIIRQLSSEYRSIFTRVKVVLRDLHSKRDYPAECKIIKFSPDGINECVQFAKVAPHQVMIQSKTNFFSLVITLEIIGVEKIITTCDNDGVVQVDYEKTSDTNKAVE